MRLVTIFAAAAATAAPSSAQETSQPQRTIQILGSGKASTMPDVAVLHYWVRGEGATTDEASRSLATKVKAINQGVNAFLQGRAKVSNSDFVVVEVRGPDCQPANRYEAQPRLSDGPCAITGYLATARGEVRTSEVGKAGTAAGLMGRLGASDGRVQSYELSNRNLAHQQALNEALANARSQAVALAASAGQRLGPVQTIRTNDYTPMSLSLARPSGVSAPPPPPPPPPPVEIELTPRPIETNAQVNVTYSLLP